MFEPSETYRRAPLPERLALYRNFATAFPERFAGRKEGGVEIISDLAGIEAAENAMGDDYHRRGMPRKWAEIGLLYEDPYLLLLRDAVRFPDGRIGVHHRVLRRTPDPSGTAVLPLLGDRIVLARHFRHPLRSWVWEAPRGAVDPGEAQEDTARRELEEEISAKVLDVAYLGRMHGATGLMGMSVSLFIARLETLGETALAEGIDGYRLVSVGEFEDMVRASEITDSFTLGCFLHARLKGLV